MITNASLFMRHCRQLAVVGIAFAALSAAQAQKVVVKLATLAPEGSSWHLTLKQMGEEWKTASGGRVTLRIYPGGVMGDEPDMIRKMRIGQIQAAAVTGTGLSEIDNGVQALQVPMLYNSEAELDYVRQKLAPQLEERMKKRGFAVLNWGEAGWVHFFTKSPVVTPNDLKAQKLFTWAGDSLTLDLWKSGGFQPVALASTDIMPGLQTGMITAFATPPMAALSFQWYSLASNMTELRWAPLIGATIMSEKTLQSIPADVREAILMSSRKAGEKLLAEVRKGSTESVEAMKKHHLNVVPVPAAAAAQWRAAAESVYDKIRGPMAAADMFDEAKRLIAEYRKQNGNSGH